MNNYLNSVYKTNRSGELKIISYENWNNVTVQFIESGYTKTSNMTDVIRGGIKDPLYPLVFKRGYIGIGTHSRKTCSKVYDTWFGMLRRCYSEDKPESYGGVSVCEEWHNFQNFAEWAILQTGYDRKGWHLDKDILCKNNLIYSPDNCAFVPARLNHLLVKMFDAKDRGRYAIGVCFLEKENKYLAQAPDLHGVRRKKYFKTEHDAFSWYKERKELFIKHLAEEYKPVLDFKIYSALISYQIEVND